MNHIISSSPCGVSARLRRKTAFTLLEMLVVMAIIVLLSVVALPSLSGLSAGGNRRAAVSQLMGVFDRARMMAISDNRTTYVVMVSGRDQDRDNPFPQELQGIRGRGYAIFEDTPDLSVKEQRTAWMYLPTGISFKTDDGAGSTKSIMNRGLKSKPPGASDLDPEFAMRAPSSQAHLVSSQMPYFKFDSTGAIDQLIQIPDYLRLFLFDGSLDNSGAEVPTKHITGTIEQRKMLFAELRLNQVTGRAKYTVDPADNFSSTQAATVPN